MQGLILSLMGLWKFQTLAIISKDFESSDISNQLSNSTTLYLNDVDQVLQHGLDNIQMAFVTGPLDDRDLDMLDSSGLFRSSRVTWVIPKPISDYQFHNLRLDSSLFLFEDVSRKSNDSNSSSMPWIILEEVYSVKNGSPIYQSLGHWSPDSGLVTSDLFIWDRRRNLGSVQLTNVIFNFPPFHWLTDDSIDGLTSDILKVLGQHLNFTIDSVEPEGGRAGAVNVNGTYSGAIGHLALGLSDLSATLLTRTLERVKYVDFSGSLLQERMTLTVKHTGKVNSYFISYSGVFSTDTWVAILITVLLLTLAFGLSLIHI